MAFSVGSTGTGTASGRRFRGSYTMAEMNIVPLVDVVLVLLIIFMVTAQMMEFGLQIEVPAVRSVRTTTEELPVVSITRSGEIYLKDQPININELGAAVRERYGENQAVYVRADRQSIFEVSAQVYDELGRAGLKVNVVTRLEDDARRRR